MAEVKLVSWNMEWMNDLFGPNDEPAAFRPDDAKPQHSSSTTVRKRRDDLSGVLNELAPDVVVVVEGPNRDAELQMFFDEDVDGDWVVRIQPTKGSAQCTGIAVRVDGDKFEDEPLKFTDTNNIAAFSEFLRDADNDGIEEQYHFERLPLLVQVKPQGGKDFNVLGLHLKSKGIFQALEWSKWWMMADANRRKILAETAQLRSEFVDPFLEADATKNAPLIICGDINDGPGLDASEKRLLGSGVEKLMGSIWQPGRVLRNVLFESLLNEKQQAALRFEEIATTRFRDPIFESTYHNVWIDHILCSDNQGGPWVTKGQVHRLLADNEPIWQKFPHASDHYPVSATVTT